MRHACDKDEGPEQRGALGLLHPTIPVMKRSIPHEGSSIMPRRNPGFGSRYKCPGCGNHVPKAFMVWYAKFPAHGDCKITCYVCNETIVRPQLGRPKDGEVYLNMPVHKECKP